MERKVIIVGFGGTGKAEILNSFNLTGLNLTDEQKETLISYGVDASMAKALQTPSIEERCKELLKQFKPLEFSTEKPKCKTWNKKYFYE